MTQNRWEGVPVDQWAQRVAEARRALGLTQTALAGRSGVTQQSISKLETGQLCPKDQVKVRLASALESSPDTIFSWNQGDAR